MQNRPINPPDETENEPRGAWPRFVFRYVLNKYVRAQGQLCGDHADMGGFGERVFLRSCTAHVERSHGRRGDQ